MPDYTMLVREVVDLRAGLRKLEAAEPPINVAAGKTLKVNHSMTLTGADGRTLTIPATGTAALLGTANVYTAKQTISVGAGVVPVEYIVNGVTRSIIGALGAQDWFLNNGVSDAGYISFSTPGGVPGILFRNTSLGGRVDISQYSSAGGGVLIYQRNSTGAVPVLCLRQDDASEEMIRFYATVGTGNAINTTALGAYYGRVRVHVEGVGAKWLALYD